MSLGWREKSLTSWEWPPSCGCSWVAPASSVIQGKAQPLRSQVGERMAETKTAEEAAGIMLWEERRGPQP